MNSKVSLIAGTGPPDADEAALEALYLRYDGQWNRIRLYQIAAVATGRRLHEAE